MIARTADLIGVKHIGIGSDLCTGHPDTVVEWMRNGKWTKTKDYGEGTKENSSIPKQPDWFVDASTNQSGCLGILEFSFVPSP